MSERVQATGFISYLESQGQMPTWHNWILMESLRRYEVSQATRPVNFGRFPYSSTDRIFVPTAQLLP